MKQRSLTWSLLFALTGLLPGCPSSNACEDICSDGGADAPLVDAWFPTDVPTVDAPIPSTDAPQADAPVTASNQVIGRGCGPADGFALNLGIYQRAGASCQGDPSVHSLHFFIHDLGGATLPPTAGSTVTSTTASSNGSAEECPGGSPPCRTSSNWSVTFDSYTADTSASGSYTIDWADGSTSSGSFDASWCEATPVICG